MDVLRVLPVSCRQDASVDHVYLSAHVVLDRRLDQLVLCLSAARLLFCMRCTSSGSSTCRAGGLHRCSFKNVDVRFKVAELVRQDQYSSLEYLSLRGQELMRRLRADSASFNSLRVVELPRVRGQVRHV